MKNISFKVFFIEHLWLFAVCILLPVVVVYLGCYFNNYDLEQGTVATIVIGVLTYIGTILWGMFIYYKSWVDKKKQEIRDWPRVDVKYIPKLDGKAFYNSQDDVIKLHLGYFNFMNINNCFLRAQFINYGIHSIHNIYHTSTTILIDDKEIEESTLNYIDATEGKALGFKETYERYIGVLIKNIPNYNTATVKVKSVFQFSDSLTNTYYLETTISIRQGYLSLPSTRVYRKE